MPQSPIATIERSGRYDVRRKLGEGTNGIVYEVHDRAHDAEVALKILRRTKAGQIYRFKNEFRQLTDISHPNLVALHELTCESDAWFFTMELVQGVSFPDHVCPGTGSGTLDETHSTLQEDGRCDIDRLRAALGQLVSAVSALHAAGKLHLDLKPSNVLVAPDGRVVVLDFGLVREWQAGAQADFREDRRIRGTPAYMSPEQAMGEPVGPASDWYSVGVMLYEVLCGRLPFSGRMEDVLRDKAVYGAPPISAAGHHLPADLVGLCDALLRRPPGERPDEEAILHSTTRVSQRPRTGLLPSLPCGPNRKQTDLIGRERELCALYDALGGVADAHPVLALVHGRSGMGKTALAKHFLKAIETEPNTMVLKGRCFERESVPYKAFDGVLDALANYLTSLPDDQAAALIPRDIRSLSRLFPVLKRSYVIARSRQRAAEETDPRVLRGRAFAALKELLGRIADAHTLVIHIDDLQWGDADSARLLLDLLSPPDPPAMLLIGAFRDEDRETSAFLPLLLQHDMHGKEGIDARDVAIDPLAPAASLELATALLRRRANEMPSLAEAIARESEGIPFFITELARHERLQGDARDTPRASVSLDGVVLQRRHMLSPAAQQLLDVLSVAARPLEQGIALQAAGLGTGSEPLLELRSARLIRTRGTRPADTAETYHDRVRQAIVKHMDAAPLRARHAALAKSLEAWGITDPERLFEHHLGAGERERAGQCALQAADTAANKLAFNRAADMYRSAIELLPAEQGNSLYDKLGEALANAGRGAQAAQAYLQAAEHAQPGYAQRLRRLAASQLLRSGRIDEGVELSKRVLRDVGLRYPESPTEAMAHVLGTRALIALRGLPKPNTMPKKQASSRLLSRLEACGSIFRELGAVEPLYGAALQSLHMRLALRAGEPNAILQGLTGLAVSTAQSGGPKAPGKVDRILELVSEMSASIGTPEAKAAALSTRAICSVYLCRFSEVTAPAREAEEIYRTQCSRGTWWERNNNNSMFYLSLQMTGDLPAIAREAPRWMLAARERDDRFSIGMTFLTECTRRLTLDDIEGATALVAEQREVLKHDRYHVLHCTLMCRTLDNYLYLGAGQRALDHLEEQWPSYAASFVPRAEFPRTVVEYQRGRCALAAGVERGYNAYTLNIARESSRKLSREATTYAHMCGRLVDAGLAHADQNHEGAMLCLEEAAAGFDAMGISLYAASARRRLGELAGNAKGLELIAQADDLLRSKGIVRPDRWSGIWVPRLCLKSAERGALLHAA